MANISQTRGQLTATVSGMGTVPVLPSEELKEDRLHHKRRTSNARDAMLAERQFDAVVRQLTAGNPERRVHAVVLDPAEGTAKPHPRLYAFTLAEVSVDRFRNGAVAYDYTFTDGEEVV